MENERKMLMESKNEEYNLHNQIDEKKKTKVSRFVSLTVTLVVVAAIAVHLFSQNQAVDSRDKGRNASLDAEIEEIKESAEESVAEDGIAEELPEETTEEATEETTEEITEEAVKVPIVYSEVDFNGNGVDDYSDFVLGARQDAINHPTYDDRWWAEAYPPDDIGVCSDVIWRAFRQAGYCFKEMVDADILARPEAYPLIEKPEHQIDFRRVRNLRIFFEKYAVSLTLDTNEIEEWQPGDIVIFLNDKHIGIVSDIRNKDGIPYIIHNGGQDDREEDYLTKEDCMPVTGHYRFDASLVPAEVLIPWTE